MKKTGTDPKVKKTLVRNYEKKIRIERKGVHDVDAGPSKLNKNPHKPLTQRDINLDEPTLCSSEVLASYLSDVRKSVPPPLSPDDLNINKSHINAKITKKLNFHFNDRIYKNLVELNADITNLQDKQDKKNTKNRIPLKKDLEPRIEDFCQEEKEPDVCPNVPILKRNITLLKGVEDGRLHRLIASFEKL
ncbi:unnamed protein product, partial [Brenthis ino]